MAQEGGTRAGVMSLVQRGKAAIAGFGRDQCTDLAAMLTYYAVLAVFPAMLALVSLLGVFGRGEQTVAAILQLLEDVGQSEAARELQGPISSMVTAGGAGFALALGVGVALWSASGYVGGFARAMNRIWDVEEGRPAVRLRLQQFGITIALVLMAALVLFGLVVSGGVAEAVGRAVGLGDQAVTLWGWLKWPAILGIVALMVAMLYHATPDVRQPRRRGLTLGAVVAIVVWVVLSIGFGFYVANVASYNRTYGSLAGVIVFLLWLWLTNLALLFGAEIDRAGHGQAAGEPKSQSRGEAPVTLEPLPSARMRRAQR